MNVLRFLRLGCLKSSIKGFCVDKPIRLIELFGGIGSQAMALRDIGADFEHYRLVEFDKYACASYNAIHGTSFEPTDIRNVHGGDLGIVDKNDWCYLLTYSFPCQSLSMAGKMEGMSKADWESGKSTRSGLLWEVERILTGRLPSIATCNCTRKPETQSSSRCLWRYSGN